MHLGHITERGMTVLSTNGFLCDHRMGKLDLFEHYVIPKQYTVKFNTTIDKTRGTIDYIPSDL